MNNIKRSKMLMEVAYESMAEAKFSFKREIWSLVVRRSQEAVELSIKGILAFLGVDHPKDHDQAPLLFNILNSQEISSKDIEEKVKLISLDLSRKRGPALQQEEGYDKKVAKNTIEDANFVLESMKNILEKVKNKYGKEI